MEKIENAIVAASVQRFPQRIEIPACGVIIVDRL
jgi:hypothetical protein